ncbi:MAG: tetratricopeptide repeat protein [Bacteroidales bacterium]|nr:tetratricopeptide repeat protein [Bacteroidales bacterium]
MLENWEEFYQTGLQLVLQKRYTEAIVFFDKALVIYPNNAEILLNKAFLLQDIGDTNGAISCFGKSLKLNPNPTMTRQQDGSYKVTSKLNHTSNKLQCLQPFLRTSCSIGIIGNIPLSNYDNSTNLHIPDGQVDIVDNVIYFRNVNGKVVFQDNLDFFETDNKYFEPSSDEKLVLILFFAKENEKMKIIIAKNKKSNLWEK